MNHRVVALNLTFLSRPAMQRLNRDWLGHDRPTDVIAFALPDPAGGVTGDVYICPPVAAQEATDRGIPLREELVRLVVHGTLHVLGYDHPAGPGRIRSRMWRLQEQHVKALV